MHCTTSNHQQKQAKQRRTDVNNFLCSASEWPFENCIIGIIEIVFQLKRNNQ